MPSDRAMIEREKALAERQEKERMWQEKRLLAAEYVMQGMSLREAAERIGGVTHQFVKIWARKLLDQHPPDGDHDSPYFTLKDGYPLLLQSKKPGPPRGRCPKVDEIYDLV